VVIAHPNYPVGVRGTAAEFVGFFQDDCIQTLSMGRDGGAACPKSGPNGNDIYFHF